MYRVLIATIYLAVITPAGLALAAQQAAQKSGTKQEARKETRSDPCEPEAPKKSATSAKKGADSKAGGSREPTKR